jgi:predicted O-linked N-acetylglucosamine transferase (SPINDLY family)
MISCSANWLDVSAEADPDTVVRAVLAGKRADLPFAFLSLSDSAAAQMQCARTFVAAACPPADPMTSSKNRYFHDRIRVAYVSADFREHAVTYLMPGVFEGHDRQRFETTAISLRSEEAGAWGQRMRGCFDRFVDVGRRSDRSVAELLRSLEIDVAVDLAGFTAGMRPGIFAHRAAPIQVNYLGYLGFLGTLGAEYFDYILADNFVIPKGSAQHYSERVAYLPDCFQANDDRLAPSVRSATRGNAGLPENGFVFCCFNNVYKIKAKMFDVWMRLLDRISGSVLWLVATDDTTRTHLRREATIRGVDPERLVFARRRTYLEYLRALTPADLFLDTVPFNAGPTASDSLRAGLPLLTCAGEAFAARMAGSILRAAGLPELVTLSLGEYECGAGIGIGAREARESASTTERPWPCVTLVRYGPVSPPSGVGVRAHGTSP